MENIIFGIDGVKNILLKLISRFFLQRILTTRELLITLCGQYYIAHGQHSIITDIWDAC